MSIEKFIALREAIDKLIEETIDLLHKEAITKSDNRIKKCMELLNKLNSLASGDIQDRVVSNRRIRIDHLAIQIDGILSKKEAGNKKAGNIVNKSKKTTD